MELSRLFAYFRAFLLISLPSISMATREDLSVLVVRGGHAYDTPEFEMMCQNLKGISVDLVLTSHMQRMQATDMEQQSLLSKIN